MQKYERGTNRIAVTTLVRAATALSAPMSFFFDGVGPQIRKPKQPMLYGGDIVIAQALAKIEARKVRAAFRTLIRALVQERLPGARRSRSLATMPARLPSPMRQS
ncbi:hypothetical protein [Mesorhizobium australicum]|uniref:hypothetical protein n=1 Tax=Mesorhizobium australicum TaxID=536018 RepID=UPI001FCDB6E2|nr:hypothetical protein [Mesorhizobium australicum]